MNADKPFSLSVRVIILNPQNCCLLMKRSNDCTHHPGMWEFPGGKLLPGENFAEALIREVKEETGLDITLQHVAGVVESELPDWRIAHLIMEAFSPTDKVRISTEHEKFTWVPLGDLPNIDMPEYFRSFAREYAQSGRKSEYKTT